MMHSTEKLIKCGIKINMQYDVINTQNVEKKGKVLIQSRVKMNANDKLGKCLLKVFTSLHKNKM